MTLVWSNPIKRVVKTPHLVKLPKLFSDVSAYLVEGTRFRWIVQSNRQPVQIQRFNKTIDDLMTDVDMVLGRNDARKLLQELKLSYDSLSVKDRESVKCVLSDTEVL